MNSDFDKHLDTPYDLPSEAIDHYRRYNYIKLKHVLAPEVLTHYKTLIEEKVASHQSKQAALDARDTYGKAFLQVFNLWRESIEISKLTLSRRLGQIATELMETKGVRIYHDQALCKEPSGGITPWHADQYYWPLDSDKTITAWIPLQAVPLAMGPLAFCAGSHVIQDGRSLEIGDDSEIAIARRLKVTDFPQVEEPFDLGEVSFHSGWIFHRAGANTTTEMRSVMTIIYMDEDMRLKNPENENQINDWHTWCPGARIGEIISTPLNPVVYSA